MLTLERIAKVFMPGTPNAVTALDRLSLTAAAGDWITVIGSNGAGKSTLVKAICGLVALDSGAIALAGRDITRDRVHRRASLIGRVAQDPHESTCAAMTVGENLAMAAKRGQPRGLHRAVTPALARRFADALAQIGLNLEGRLETRVGLLSGGQRQAVAMLMATIAQPKLLLLDEHLANLDPKTGDAVMQLTARIVEQAHLTTIMVTHNMNDAIRWGNRLVMMHAGRIVFEVTGRDKAALGVADLVARFHAASGEQFAGDRALLAQ